MKSEELITEQLLTEVEAQVKKHENKIKLKNHFQTVMFSLLLVFSLIIHQQVLSGPFSPQVHLFVLSDLLGRSEVGGRSSKSLSYFDMQHPSAARSESRFLVSCGSVQSELSESLWSEDWPKINNHKINE